MPSTRTPQKPWVWVRDVPLLRGVINGIQPRMLPAESVVELFNGDLDDVGLPKKRDGYSATQVGVQGLPADNPRPAGLGYLDAGASSRLMAMAVRRDAGGGVYFVTTPDTTSGWTEAKTADGNGFDVDTDNAKMVQGNDLLWILPGGSQNVHALKPDGELIDCRSDTNETPVKGAADIAWLGVRLWMLQGERLYWSKLLPTAEDLEGTPAAFDRTNITLNGGGSLVLSPPHGQEPVALVPWSSTSLIAFYKNSILEVALNFSDPSLSSIRVVEPNIGCGARESIVALGPRLYFMDQWGEYREIGQTISGVQQGVMAEPLSDSIREALPGSLNLDRLDLVRAVLFRENIYIAVPTAGSLVCDQVWVYSTSRRHWIGPWEFADAVGHWLVSDIRGGRHELFFTDGDLDGSLARVFRMFDGSYADNGQGITYRETTKVWDFDQPESVFTPRWLEVEVGGGAGALVLVSAKTDPNEDFRLVNSFSVEVNDGADFPLYEAGENDSQFPLEEEDFPLLDVVPKITRNKQSLDSVTTGGMPLFNNSFPLFNCSFPLFNAESGLTRGRFIQIRFEETSAGTGFQRYGFRMCGVVENPVFDESEG